MSVECDNAQDSLIRAGVPAPLGHGTSARDVQVQCSAVLVISESSTYKTQIKARIKHDRHRSKCLPHSCFKACVFTLISLILFRFF